MTNETKEFWDDFGKWIFKWGNILAAIVSYSINKSVWWAFLHGVFSWFYLGYVWVRSMGPMS